MGSEDKALGPKGEGCEWVRTEGQQGWGGGGEAGHRQGAQSRGGKHRDRQRELLPELCGCLCLCPWPSTGRVPPRPPAKLGHPGLNHQFLFFFSFASLASSASWSLMSFTLLLPSGVLKYQSWWEEEGEVGGHELHPRLLPPDLALPFPQTCPPCPLQHQPPVLLSSLAQVSC